MKKVIIRVCLSCNKCQDKIMDLLKKTEGVKEVIFHPAHQKIEAIGDFKVDDIFRIFEHCKFQKKFAIQSIEELPPPPPKPEPPKAPPPAEPPKTEEKKKEPSSHRCHPIHKKDKEEPPKKEKEKEKEKEKPKEKQPEPEPEHCYHPPTIIFSDCQPSYSTYEAGDSSCGEAPRCQGSDSFDLAILIGLVLVVMVLLASVSSSSSTSSMSEAAATFISGFVESTISTLGTLFLIVLALFAIMGFLCLADPRPQPCKC